MTLIRDPVLRTRRQAITQSMLALMAVVLGVFVIVNPLATLGPLALAAIIVILILTAVMFVVRRLPVLGDDLWIAAIPLIDLLACAVIRADALATIPASGVIVAFPMLWLAFSFPLWAGLLGVGATVFVTLSPFFAAGRLPDTAAQWAIVAVLPIGVTLLAAVAYGVARTLSAQVAELSDTSGRLRSALESGEQTTVTLRALAEATTDAVAVFAPDGSTILVNEFALRLAALGGASNDLGRPSSIPEVYAEDRVTPTPMSGEYVEAALRGLQLGPDTLWVGAPGEQLAVRITARPVRDPDGRIVGAMLLAHDITALVEAVEVRDRFLDTVGHELKTPLTTILGHADLLQDGGDPAVRRAGSVIESAGERLLATVDGLLAAGRADIVARPQEVALRPVVQQVFELNRDDAEQHRIALDLVQVPDADAAADEVWADPRQLTRILHALVRNAVLFSRPGGTVTVTIDQDGRDVVVDVLDRGAGMTTDEVRQAFDRFYRTDAARALAVPGTGVGLTIARTLAEANGGTVTLDSTVGRGTRARLRLPRTR